MNTKMQGVNCKLVMFRCHFFGAGATVPALLLYNITIWAMFKYSI